MSLAILGLATAVPQRTVAQGDAAELAKPLCCHTEDQARSLLMLYQRTRIRRRGSVLLESSCGPEIRQSFFPSVDEESDRGPTTQQRMERYAQEATPLALAAARQALAEAGVPASHITQLITVSCTGFVAPGVDIALIKTLGLPSTIGRTHVGFMGCHGALNGLRVALSVVDADPKARVLLCAVELCSLHFQYGWDPQKAVANALFGDGAAALVATSAERAPQNTWRMVASGSYLFPDSEEAMTWRIGDHGFEMTLSPRVPFLIAEHLGPWLGSWLTRQGLTVPQIQSWAIHPGGPRILSAVADCLHLPDSAIDASNEVLAEHGNMSSPTTLFILERLRQDGAPRPCVALGFGPGLSVEAALFT